jgi:hypothetical protein
MARIGIGEIRAMKAMSAREAQNNFGLMIDTARAGPVQIEKDIEGSAIGADSEDDFKGLFDDLDVDSGKLAPTAEIARIVARQAELRSAIGAIVADLEGADLDGNAA